VTPAGTDVLVNVHGRTVSATLNGRRTGRGADLARQTQGEARIVAPMPGRIVRVLVGVGDHVAIRQPLVVVEAMKMENELRAPKAGRVKDVSATAGASVEAGRVLLVID
ncbi:MAG TPA: acetyl-CoA carboxylase biotin carboxyl carrier protein subunit, partial [Vicinamibacterales bacterium]|nr:acetyl-CoA carboxylase biotin carboxyl carrier protein subunit [Vicinamibacterales bacterium]